MSLMLIFLELDMLTWFSLRSLLLFLDLTMKEDETYWHQLVRVILISLISSWEGETSWHSWT